MTHSESLVLSYRPLLFSIAYELLGDIKDAEDAVQETFLKWFERETAHVEKVKPYLVKTVKNTCFNWMERAGKLSEIKEELSLPTLSSGFSQLFDFEMDMDLSKAYQVLSQKLNINEKSVYLLREVFEFDYSEIASELDQKAENCRKVLERARKKIEEGNKRFQLETDKLKESFQAFQNACKLGSMQEMLDNLKDELGMND